MNCTICKEWTSAARPHGNLRLATPSDGIFDLGTICETCVGKLIDFIAALGWLPRHLKATEQSGTHTLDGIVPEGLGS